MKSEWHEVQLRQISQLITKGTTPTTLGMGFAPNGINFIKAESITDDGRIDQSKFAFIDSLTHETLRRSQIEENDLLMSMAGVYLGKVAVVPPNIVPANTNQALAIIRLDKNTANPRFVAYYLRNREFNTYINNLVAQSAQPNLNLTEIGNLPLRLPPLAEQRAIAHILGALDDKIEQNRRMNVTLESMARAIFKSWFVDFDPVRAKAEGREPGLPDEIANLFPDRFEDSELGEIPAGWEVWRVADLGNVICGKTPSTSISEYYGNDVPFITIPDMHGKIFATTTQKSLSSTGAASQQKKTLPAGALCVSCIATPGLVVITSEESQTNQQINSVVPNTSNETLFWFWRFRDLGHEIMAGGSGGSVLTNLSTGRFTQLRVLASPAGLRGYYHSLVAPLFNQILVKERESHILATLRDTLLPKLLSREIRVTWATKAEKVESLA